MKRPMMTSVKRAVSLLSLAAILIACGGLGGCDEGAEGDRGRIELLGSEGESPADAAARRQRRQERFDAEMAVARKEADVRILFIGNSHSSAQLVELFAALMREGDDGIEVFVDARTAGNATLLSHSEAQTTLDAIDEGPWDYVVLQGQRYSTTGRYSYPFDGAIALAKRIHDNGAQPVLFPEWGQRGWVGEAERVQALHEELSKIIDAPVIPVGLAWEAALDADPDLVLHASDGNHAAAMGNYLTACVFYGWFSGRDPTGRSAAGAQGISDDDRALLQRAAWETVRAADPPSLEMKSKRSEQESR